jgi:hypothetical protein
MNGSSLHFFKTGNRTYKSYHLSIFPEWRLDPLSLKNRCLIAILHLFSVETAFELSLTYIINQTITKSDIRI